MVMTHKMQEKRSTGGIFNAYDIRLDFMTLTHVGEFTVLTPTNISLEELKAVLTSTHVMLMEDYIQEKGVYHEKGCTPATLLDYICDENLGWTWENIAFDLELKL